ncbi:MAG: putative 26S proteasome regulatory subunit [Trizodia sp. TS-e1964]|nr:MAG: putative 26S proteasome regulatory subunit [Trizodia sp. TS-e1964]
MRGLDPLANDDVEAQKYITAILHTYKALSNLPKLEPSPVVNSLFQALVEICSCTPTSSVVTKVLTNPYINEIGAKLQQLCSTGEFQLEKYWSQKIYGAATELASSQGLIQHPHLLVDPHRVLMSGEAAHAALQSFPYYQNYKELTRLELNTVLAVKSGEPPSTVTFIGSGPLPLTSIFIADMLKNDNLNKPITIHNIDHCPKAVALSSALCQALGSFHSQVMRFQCADASDDQIRCPLQDSDVVYIAALVRSIEGQKRQLITHIASQMRPGALLVLRSAHSLRSLMYSAIDLERDVSAISSLQLLLEVHPYHDVVNSVVIARICEKRHS